MTANGKIRLGAALLIAGELFALATQRSATAASLLAFVFVAGALIALGAVLGTWGVVQLGQQR